MNPNVDAVIIDGPAEGMRLSVPLFTEEITLRTAEAKDVIDLGIESEELRNKTSNVTYYLHNSNSSGKSISILSIHEYISPEGITEAARDMDEDETVDTEIKMQSDACREQLMKCLLSPSDRTASDKLKSMFDDMFSNAAVQMEAIGEGSKVDFIEQVEQILISRFNITPRKAKEACEEAEVTLRLGQVMFDAEASAEAVMGHLVTESRSSSGRSKLENTIKDILGFDDTNTICFGGLNDGLPLKFGKLKIDTTVTRDCDCVDCELLPEKTTYQFMGELKVSGAMSVAYAIPVGGTISEYSEHIEELKIKWEYSVLQMEHDLAIESGNKMKIEKLTEKLRDSTKRFLAIRPISEKRITAFRRRIKVLIINSMAKGVVTTGTVSQGKALEAIDTLTPTTIAICIKMDGLNALSYAILKGNPKLNLDV